MPKILLKKLLKKKLAKLGHSERYNMSKIDTLMSYLLNEGKLENVGEQNIGEKIADIFFDDGLNVVNYVDDAVTSGNLKNVIRSVEEAYEEFIKREHEEEPEVQMIELSDELKNQAFKTVATRLMDPALNEAYKGPKKYKKVVGSGKNKKTVRYGAKGYSIAPGTSKGDSYCARSYGQMKDHPSAAKDANSPLRLSRKKWRCSKDKSRKS
jgi:hypothetical protein